MYKITPSTYIRDLKFYQAALHITESNEPIKKIAHSVGISNYEHFSKMFRVVFNANPKSFREKPF